MNDADLIVIGSGHNGLVCAAYAACAGHRVLVCERREDIGGAVCTRTMFGGYQMDVGGSLHTLIRATPIIADLSLHRYGLEYIEVDPIFSAPHTDGRVLHVYKDIDQTCSSIATFSTKDADRYRVFVQEWLPITRSIFRLFCKPPTLSNIGRYLLLPHHGFRGKKRLSMLRTLLQSYGTFINNTFEHPHVRAAFAWWGAQSGPPPDERASAALFTWQAMLHDIGAARPKGGSGMLTHVLARYIEDHGGKILCNQEVTQILVENNQAIGVATAQSRYRAKVVVCNAHILHLFNTMLSGHSFSALFRRKVNNISIGNGFGMVIRCATDSLPRYPLSTDDHKATVQGLQLLCPTTQYLNDAYADYLYGMPARAPAALAMTFSAIDPTLAPPGKHVLFVWGQYYPYKLRRGTWKEIAQQESEKLLQVVNDIAPGTRDSVTEYYTQTPEEISRLHAMPAANVMHVDMTIDSMFLFRPFPELSRYATPVNKLYIANAGMHPGGGIFGAAGYNCAQIINSIL